jgi:hypothetical protein
MLVVATLLATLLQTAVALPPANQPRGTYVVGEVVTRENGYLYTLEYEDISLSGAASPPPFAPPIVQLSVDVTIMSSDTLHVKIFDAKKKRWEVPEAVTINADIPDSLPIHTFDLTPPKVGSPFTLNVKRFDSRPKEVKEEEKKDLEDAKKITDPIDGIVTPGTVKEDPLPGDPSVSSSPSVAPAPKRSLLQDGETVEDAREIEDEVEEEKFLRTIFR